MSAAEERKRFDTLRARLALVGWSVIARYDDWGGLTFVMAPVASTRTASTLDEAERIASALEAYQAQRAAPQQAAA